jgi:HEAT repeat protein
VRQNAAWALVSLGPKAAETVPLLIRTLGDERPTTRVNAVKALGAIGPAARSALPALRALRGGSDADLQRAITDALNRIESTRG